jgi:hypothetical protein
MNERMKTVLRTMKLRVAASLLAMLAIVSVASASVPALSLGEVSLIGNAPAAYKQILADALSNELASAAEAQTRPGRSYVVNARLAFLETKPGSPVKTQCRVSLVLTERGSILAMSEGRVTVQEYVADRAEVRAIQAAARSALKSFSSVLAR